MNPKEVVLKWVIDFRGTGKSKRGGTLHIVKFDSSQ